MVMSMPMLMKNPLQVRMKRVGRLVPITYTECMKNHAASIGGHAKDGCQEFLEDHRDVFRCGVCGCHRNYHRMELDIASLLRSPPPMLN